MTYLVAIGPPTEQIRHETHRLFIARKENLKELILDPKFAEELDNALSTTDPASVALHIAPYVELEELRFDNMTRIDVCENKEAEL